MSRECNEARIFGQEKSSLSNAAKSDVPMNHATTCVGNKELGSRAMKPAKGLF